MARQPGAGPDPSQPADHESLGPDRDARRTADVRHRPGAVPPTMWCFHSDGITPDPVGVYRHPLATERGGSPPHGADGSHRRVHSLRGVRRAASRTAIYMGLEWSCCRIETVTLSSGALAVGPRARGQRGRSPAWNSAPARRWPSVPDSSAPIAAISTMRETVCGAG